MLSRARGTRSTARVAPTEREGEAAAMSQKERPCPMAHTGETKTLSVERGLASRRTLVTRLGNGGSKPPPYGVGAGFSY